MFVPVAPPDVPSPIAPLPDEFGSDPVEVEEAAAGLADVDTDAEIEVEPQAEVDAVTVTEADEEFDLEEPDLEATDFEDFVADFDDGTAPTDSQFGDLDPETDETPDLAGRYLALAIAASACTLVILFVIMGRPLAEIAINFSIIGLIGLAVAQGILIVKLLRQRDRVLLTVSALVVCITVNPVTMVAARVLSSSLGQAAPPALNAPSAKEWELYPGLSYVEADDILQAASLEEFIPEANAVLAEVREALTAEFGLVWVERQAAQEEMTLNGYGGDSMLTSYTTPRWQSTTTLRTVPEKQRAVEIMQEVIEANGAIGALLTSAPDEGQMDDYALSEYGGVTLETQARWLFYGHAVALGAGQFKANIVDLSIDTTGNVRKDQESYAELYGLSPEGIDLSIDSFGLLPGESRDEFKNALKRYEGHEEPE